MDRTGRPNKKRKAARQREAKKKIKREIVDPLAWTFEDPWRSSGFPCDSGSESACNEGRLNDIVQPVAVQELDDLPVYFPVECGSLPAIPLPPEAATVPEVSIVSFPDFNVNTNNVFLPPLPAIDIDSEPKPDAEQASRATVDVPEEGSRSFSSLGTVLVSCGEYCFIA